MLTVHKTLVTDWLTYVRNTLQPSFVSPFDVVGSRHSLTMPTSSSGPVTMDGRMAHNSCSCAAVTCRLRLAGPATWHATTGFPLTDDTTIHRRLVLSVTGRRLALGKPRRNSSTRDMASAGVNSNQRRSITAVLKNLHACSKRLHRTHVSQTL